MICKVCGSKDYTIQVKLVPGSQYFRCGDCQLVYQYPLPATPVLKDLYGREDDKYFKDEGRGIDYVKGEPWLRATASFYIDQITRYYDNDLATANVLDFGCATGVMLDEFKKRGADVTGIELSKWSCKYAREKYGLMVYNENIFDVKLPESTFDIITTSHVIEHVTDPVAVIKRLGQLLKPGGLLFIAVPDVDSLGCSIFGKRWHYYLPDEHLYLFNERSINRAVISAGLNCLDVKHYLWRKRTSLQAALFLVITTSRFALKKIFSYLPFGNLFPALRVWRKLEFQYGTSKDGMIVFVTKQAK